MDPQQIKLHTDELREIARRNRYVKLKLPDHPRFKLKVWWKDGNESAHFSFDMCNKRDPDGGKINFRDEKYGLAKLLRMMEREEYQGKFISAIIFATLDELPQRVRDDVRPSNYNIRVWQRNGQSAPRFHITPLWQVYNHSTHLNRKPFFNQKER